MRTTVLLTIGLLAGTTPLLVSPGAAYAQQTDATYEHPGSRLDVDFSGGTLEAYVETLRKTRPRGAANVVIAPDARSLKIPPISLVAVTVDAAIQVLEGPYTLPDGRRAHVNVSSYHIADSEDLVLKVTVDVEPLSIRSSVWNVEAALAAGQSAEELLGAVEAVLSLYSQKAEISFHPPTRLLIARGSDEQLDLMGETIDQLIDGAQRRRDEIESIRNEIGMLEGELSRVKGRVRVAEQSLALASSRLERAASARDRTDITGDVFAEAQLEATQAETELDVENIAKKQIEARLGGLRDSLKKWEQPRE